MRHYFSILQISDRISPKSHENVLMSPWDHFTIRGVSVERKSKRRRWIKTLDFEEPDKKSNYYSISGLNNLTRKTVVTYFYFVLSCLKSSLKLNRSIWSYWQQMFREPDDLIGQKVARSNRSMVTLFLYFFFIGQKEGQVKLINDQLLLWLW